jgi:selenocysteine lyase/cysteine desulfurase
MADFLHCAADEVAFGPNMTSADLRDVARDWP